MTDHCNKQNLSAATSSMARGSTDANRSNKDVKTRNSNKKMEKVPAKRDLGRNEYSAFRAASGWSSGTGNMEVTLSMTDYLDVAGTSWTAFGYNPQALPGFAPGAGVQFTKLMLHGLEPVIAGSNSTNNFMVLAGSLCEEGSFGTDPQLMSGQQTLMKPSNDPEWVHLLTVNLLNLADKGYIGVPMDTLPEVAELARLSLINPDTGVFSTSATMQLRIELTYRLATPLQGTAQITTRFPTTVTSVLGTVTNGSTAVFPRVVGSSQST